jgi:hypothetical protein
MRTVRLPLAAAVLLAACASLRPAGGGGAGPAVDAWLRGGAAGAGRALEDAVRGDPADPWARWGAAALARRGLDEAGEAGELVALVQGAPDHPLAAVAARRLGELAEVAPPLAEAVQKALAAAQPRLAGMTAFRARAARAAAAVARGDEAAAAALRAENGVVVRWTLCGPFGGLHALELDVPFAPERGALPAAVPGARGQPDAPARAVPVPDGAVSLEAEGPGDVYYLAADATAARGGEYLLTLGGTVSLRAFLDGAPVAERRVWTGYRALGQTVALRLAPGRHRLLVKLTRGGARAHFAAALARADGAPSDVAFEAPARGGAADPVRPGSLPPPVPGALAHLPRLEAEAGPLAARLALARDALDLDRELAKRLLDEAVALAPRSAALLAARAEARRGDPALSERVGRARAEADLDRALAADPGDAAARLARAELARVGERLDDAAALLDGLAEPEAARPPALLARARVALARGLSAPAERLARDAVRVGGHCAALELLQDLASRRDALARQDELVQALARCPGGRERLVEHRRRRGDLAGALALSAALAREAPGRADAALVHAGLLAASGDPRGGAEEVAALARLWPRDPRLAKREAELREAAGELDAARAARERALVLDGSDLALRRALALDDGREPLSDLDEDGRAAIAAYRAAAPPGDSSSVNVLDLGAVEAHPGGAYTELIHEVIEARDQRAVDRAGEVAVPDGAELLVARTIKRDGSVLEPDEPVGDKRTLSLPGLEPGDFAEWAWLRSVPSRGAGVPGFTADPFFFRGDAPLWRSTYAAAAPAALGLELDGRGVTPPSPEVRNGRAVMRVARERVPALHPEPGAPSDSEHVPFVQAGAGGSQEDLARALADALLDGFRPSREVAALADEVRASVPEASRGPEALARAAYRRVDELVTGQGGSWTEPAAAVLSRGRGSRTVLLQALLDVLGIRSRVALVRDFGRDPGPFRFPRPDLWGYAVLRVEAGGREVWLDPTTRHTPFGVLPASARGCAALVLPYPGEAVRAVRTPAGEPEPRRVKLTAALDAEGGATVEGREEYVGFEASSLRASLERLDPSARRQAAEGGLARSFPGPALLDLAVEGEADPDAPVVLRWKVRVDRWARRAGERLVVDAPLFPARMGARFVQRAARETPLLVAADEHTTLEVEVTPPPGFRAVAGQALDVPSAWGRYTRADRTTSVRLVRSDGWELRRARVPPGEFAAFGAFAAEVDGAQGEPMVFERVTQGDGPPVAAGG